MKSCIIATGNELTEGIILDKNSKYLAERLKSVGYDTLKITNVKDDLSLIKLSIEESLEMCDIIFLTGGLGPTQDDLTVQAVSESCNIDIVFNEELFEKIKKYYYNKTGKYLSILKKQSYVLKNAEILQNPVGSAPGQKVHFNGHTIYLLPGPYNEMKAIFDTHIYDELKSNMKNDHVEYSLYFYGLTEAELMQEVSVILKNFDYSTKIEEYIGPSLRIRMQKNDDFEPILEKILSQFSRYFIGFKSLEITLFDVLMKSSKTLSFAESCTGGMLSDTLVSIPGASNVFKGSLVTYSNESKVRLLDVKKETIEKFGAVSEETVKEMAYGLKKIMESDICVSVSGIAGPSLGSEQKPVGTVWYGFLINEDFFALKNVFTGDRDEIRKRATYFAFWNILDLVRKRYL
ncbi:competence/damage-inducible protein CinA [Petrotoga mobilis SJ95]|uniref:CinA-like protein n=1 Tax=Petrotoga mobilis (strain DSM 10674 / SJ95) TaxID=403833 RepID=CINAL_PETMO|nr:CinA family nicotinamide mononucleotide deamidase-related protein [Petrotoga mobilis]A9BHX8.1 RecName: Full=CinA-like protein [Petrotoga mobilis SJ95]ABX32093.1 competence/damage-inducible protein CinA [Petrotoga mobilis SJ95]